MKILFIILLFVTVTTFVTAQETKTYSVYFNTAVYQPDAVAMKTLNTIALQCKSGKAGIISISGYSDSVGTTERNQLLSERRANSVKEIFAQKAIDLKTAVVAGKNETTEFGGADFYKNRRVDIVTKATAQKPDLPLDKKIEEAGVGDLIRLENMTFYNNISIPLPESIPVMEELYRIMSSEPTLVIAIEGHICCVDDDISNLSGERAKVVYDFLLDKGIEESRMSWKGFGHTRPLNNETTAEEKQMNRRVEIRVVKK